MVIKEKFTLLKGTKNVLNLSPAYINAHSIEIGPRKVFAVALQPIKNRIDHFSKKRIFDLVTDVKKRKSIHVVNLPTYNLHISYNKKTNGIIINLNSFGVDDIYPESPGPRNIYASMVYGICFADLASGRFKVKDSYYSVFSSYLLSVFIRLFGKEYGLLGPYSIHIPRLNFLINCYVLSSFFGIDGMPAFRKAATSSSFDYKILMPELQKVDFSDIGNFIEILSRFKVMPGLDKYGFTAKILKLLTINFLPLLEDMSRFISILTTSSIKGSTIVPTFLSKYNETEFNKILKISEAIFKRKN